MEPSDLVRVLMCEQMSKVGMQHVTGDIEQHFLVSLLARRCGKLQLNHARQIMRDTFIEKPV